MKGGRSLRPTQHRVQKKKGVFGKTHKRDNVCQEVFEAEGGEYLPQKSFSRSQGNFMLVNWPWWARNDDLVHHCGGKCSLSEFSSHSSQQISVAPAIPYLSRNMKACGRQIGLWWPLSPGLGRKGPWGRHRWSGRDVWMMALQMGSCWSGSACSPKSTRHWCSGPCPWNEYSSRFQL